MSLTDPHLGSAPLDQEAPQSRPAPQDSSLGHRIAKFIAGTIKLGLAIGIALLVVSGVAILVVLGNQKREQAQRETTLKPLRHVKQWPPSEVLDSSRATIETKWGDNEVLVRLTLADVPSHGFVFNDGARFILRFIDADGFNLAEHTIATNELSRTLEGEKVTGYEWQGSVSTSPDAYARAQSWTLLWAGVSLPQAAVSTTHSENNSGAPERWKVRTNWRKIRAGMHEGEVRRLLGEPTYVEVSVYKYWVYGGRNWALYPHVRFSDGIVDGWQEP